MVFRRTAATAFIAAVAAQALLPATAWADTVDGGGGGYAAWTFGGETRAYAGTMRLGGGFPDATLTSDARAASNLVSGASTFLNTATPPGAKYGLSQNRQYLNLRPNVDLSVPSTTTYTFASPTPAANWMFALGDIDADTVTVSGLDASGAAVPVAALGFRGVFNYCGGSPSACPASNTDTPAWDPATGTLRGNGPDTAGAAAWFEPTVPLSSLTLSFLGQSGFPIYQTWFASLANDVAGTVTGCPGGDMDPAGGVAVRLVKDGNVVAETVTAADGTYAFTNYHAQSGYTVETDAPDGCEAAQPRAVSTADGDATGVDFTLRQTPAPDEETPGEEAPGGDGAVADLCGPLGWVMPGCAAPSTGSGEGSLGSADGSLAPGSSSGSSTGSGSGSADFHAVVHDVYEWKRNLFHHHF